MLPATDNPAGVRVVLSLPAALPAECSRDGTVNGGRRGMVAPGAHQRPQGNPLGVALQVCRGPEIDFPFLAFLAQATRSTLTFLVGEVAFRLWTSLPGPRGPAAARPGSRFPSIPGDGILQSFQSPISMQIVRL